MSKTNRVTSIVKKAGVSCWRKCPAFRKSKKNTTGRKVRLSENLFVRKICCSIRTEKSSKNKTMLLHKTGACPHREYIAWYRTGCPSGGKGVICTNTV